MAAHVLVVASVTATSDDLMAALDERVRRASVPVDFRLVMPAAGPDPATTRPRLDEALERWREAGFDAKGMVGDPDPVVAVHEAWDPRAYDEVIVSTLPGQTSRWMQFDFPHRVGQITGLPVSHVESRQPRQPRSGPLPEREKPALGPLTLRAPRRR